MRMKTVIVRIVPGQLPAGWPNSMEPTPPPPLQDYRQRLSRRSFAEAAQNALLQF